MKTLLLPLIRGGSTLALLLVLGCVSTSRFEQAERERDQARAEASALEAERSRLASQRDDLDQERNRLQTELAGINGEMALIRSQNAEAQERIAHLQQENANASDQLDASRTERNRERTRLQMRIAALESRLGQLDARSRRLLDELRSIQHNREMAERDLDIVLDSLVVNLENELSTGDVTVSRVEGMVRLSFRETALFESGQANIDARGRRALANIAEVLRRMPGMTFYVEGHTDSRRIGSGLVRRYPTNWELGAARAVTVVRHLTEREGIDASRLAAVTHGQHRPIADNSNPAGRAQNRRIEIALLRAPTALSQPGSSAAAMSVAPVADMKGDQEIESASTY